MLRKLFGSSAAPVEERAQASTWGTWNEPTPTWAGVKVDRESSLQLLTVYGCTRLICDSISTLPVDVFRERSDGSREEIPTPFWLAQPTVDLDYTAWATQVLASLLLEGNAYVAITRNDQGRIVEMIPLDPARVDVRRVAGRKVFIVGGVQYPGQVLHLTGAMLPGSDKGMSPLEYARQTIGLGLAAVQHGAKFFSQGQALSGVIEHPDKLTPDRIGDIAKQWARKHAGGANAYLPGVLDSGAKWTPTSVTNEQAQFLQSRGFTAAEIAGQMFLVDPSDLGIGVAGSSLTYANLLERTTRRVQVTLLPWIVRLEHALSSLLARPQYVKINVDGLLRGDAVQRWATYEAASRINANAFAAGMDPVLLTSEMRDFEDLGPVPTTSDPTPDPASEVVPMNAGGPSA